MRQIDRAPAELRDSARRLSYGYKFIRVWFSEKYQAWMLAVAADDCKCGSCWEKFYLSDTTFQKVPMSPQILVEIPQSSVIHHQSRTWIKLAGFTNDSEGRAEALEFIREKIGPCDDEGRICVLKVPGSVEVGPGGEQAEPGNLAVSVEGNVAPEDLAAIDAGE